jgi:hypothetical protein
VTQQGTLLLPRCNREQYKRPAERRVSQTDEVKSSSHELLYRVNGSDYSRRSNCDTADGSNWGIVNCVSVRVSVE